MHLRIASYNQLHFPEMNLILNLTQALRVNLSLQTDEPKFNSEDITFNSSIQEITISNLSTILSTRVDAYKFGFSQEQL